MAARTLSSKGPFDEVVIGENRYQAALQFSRELGGGAAAVEVDANDPASLEAAMAGCDVVLNCVGPFYTYGPPILRAAISSGVRYVDVCDDLDATEMMLELDGAARDAGVSALIGMGNSPGLANVIARWCADTMLERVEEVNIYHAHGGEPSEGGGVIKHRIHAMTNDIPLFIDGEFVTVRMLEESGQKYVLKTEFKGIGTFPVYPYPHPETITMPKYFDGIKRVTNMGFVLPLDYFSLTMDTVRLGICTEEPLAVQGQEVIPIEFAVAYIISRRQGFIDAAGLTEPTGCLKVEVKGEKDGEPHTYIFSMFSSGAGAGEGTGIPAALGAMMMADGLITEVGVFPPEAGVDPVKMLELAGRVLKGTGMGEGGVPIFIEHIDRDGRIESIDFKL